MDFKNDLWVRNRSFESFIYPTKSKKSRHYMQEK